MPRPLAVRKAARVRDFYPLRLSGADCISPPPGKNAAAGIKLSFFEKPIEKRRLLGYTDNAIFKRSGGARPGTEMPARLSTEKGLIASCRRKAGLFLNFKALLMDEEMLTRAVTRISHQILEKNKGAENLVLLGIRRRGVPLAAMIRDNIQRFEGVTVPCGELDIRLYRDDLTPESVDPVTRKIDLPFPVTGKKVVIVDDVLYTGRTIRAAIDAVFSVGRPAAIQFAVLIDRGHRELPVSANFVGKNIPTSRKELVAVCLPEYDGRQCVELYDL